MVDGRDYQQFTSESAIFDIAANELAAQAATVHKGECDDPLFFASGLWATIAGVISASRVRGRLLLSCCDEGDSFFNPPVGATRVLFYCISELLVLVERGSR